jgi:hypothetical protein
LADPISEIEASEDAGLICGRRTDLLRRPRSGEISMGFAIPKQSGLLPLPPYPPNDPRWNERDQFGLLIIPPTLLGESTEEKRARIATVEGLARDLFNTAVTHLGRDEARRLFTDVAKERWVKGKQPNHDRNRRLLQMYDAAVRESSPPDIKSIPGTLGKKLHAEDRDFQHSQPPSIAKQIRVLVKERDRREKAMAEAYRQVDASLLGTASSSRREK